MNSVLTENPPSRSIILKTLVVTIVGLVLAPSWAMGQLSLNEPKTLTTTTGHTFTGRIGSLPKMGATKSDLRADSTHYGIVLIDDDLREVFLSRHNVANEVPLDRFEEEFEIWQRVHNGDGLGTEIGAILQIGPFDGYGRRRITVDTRRGPETVLQGITRINPRYVRLQGIVNTLGPEEHWDMRLALSSVPKSVIVEVLERQIRDVDDSNERMRLVDFYVQAKMYREAEKALRSIGRDFPGLRKELEERGDLLRGQIARQALDEARLRADVGQPQLALAMLKPLEQTIGIASGILVEVNDLKKQIVGQFEQVEATRKQVLDMVKKVREDPDLGSDLKAVLEVFSEEIRHELSLNNIERMATFSRLADDPDQSDAQKVALALSGWILGAGSAINNIGEAQSLLETRDLVLEYLRTPRPERRMEILARLEEMETGAPEYLDQVVKHILPPLAPSPNELTLEKPMRMEIEIPGGPGQPPETASYLVQLPPEYDPWRRYPCIIALGGYTYNTTPEAEINWWCGRLHPRLKIRTGHAARNGYIVIAPDWMEQQQEVYEYSAREHAVVLKSLRDAIRHFSVDTDRVFLTGHFAGANAAWDIGQAHPEHWTGVIPISARVEKYVNHYYTNGKFHSQWYFVNGARDFDSKRANSNVWNRRMISPDYDTIVVHYHGRGLEKFTDELPNLFDWMNPQRRQFAVRQFECASLRPWDNYFWWLEVDLSDNPKMIMPEVNWESVRNRSRWDITGEIKDSRPNLFYIRGASDDATIWLSPELVDFTKDVEIDGLSGEFKGGVQPSRKTLLEDVRTRADRQHPYWAKIVRRNKNWSVEE